MKSTIEIVQRIAYNVLNFAKGGTYSYQGDGWSHTCGTKNVRYNFELDEIKRLATRRDVQVTRVGLDYQIIFVDTETDTEYDICTKRAQYIGRPDEIMVDVVYNASIANA